MLNWVTAEEESHRKCRRPKTKLSWFLSFFHDKPVPAFTNNYKTKKLRWISRKKLSITFREILSAQALFYRID